ncbi:insulinase family protein [Rosettibacter firmus]|uniref:insulinase family protein n=1 Tax=Rosettibacter firmus TaxID=3111522 RepID=UPI00336BB408
MVKKLLLIISLVFIFTSLNAQVDRSKRPQAGPAPEVKIGEYESFELPNGLKVFVVENHKLPRVTFNLYIDIDPILEGENVGYVSAAGELLKTGTKTRTKDQIDEEIDFIGAELSTSANGITASGLEKHKEKILEIMADIALNANFKQEELDKIKKQMLSAIAVSKDEPNSIARRVSSVLMFGKNHPYGEPETEESINSITLEMCKEYYQTYFRPNVAYLAVVGDITKEKAKSLIQKYFGKWEKKEVPKKTYDTPKPPLINKVCLVDRPNSVQSVIAICYPVELKVGSEDEIKASVTNLILGGSATGRLFMNLREAKGYTYGSYSQLKSDPLIGNFIAFAQVRNSVTDSSITEILKEMKRIRNEKISQEELDKAKNYLAGEFIRSLENPATIAQFAINTARFNLPKDYYRNYLKNLAAVTVDDVMEMAKKYILPSNSYLLVVGNGAEISEKLKNFSITGKIEYYDVFGNLYDPSQKKLPAGLTVDQVLNKYIDVIGGKEKINSIKDRTIKLSGSTQGMNITVTISQKYPDKLLQVIDAGVFQQKTVFDGEKGKVEVMGQVQDLNNEQIENLKGQAIDAVLDYSKYGIKPELVAIETINGKDAYKVTLTSSSGNKTIQYYDVESGYLIRIVSNVTTPQGTFTQTMDMSDYREVNGIKYPFKYIQSFGPQSIELTVLSVEMNTGLPDSLFEVK